MVQIRKGMVEAILLPFFDMQDLIHFGGLSKDCRKLLNPKEKSHVNFSLLFKQQEPDLDNDAFKDCNTWRAILEVCADLFGQMRLVNGQLHDKLT
jgi:hypothetical protein